MVNLEAHSRLKLWSNEGFSAKKSLQGFKGAEYESMTPASHKTFVTCGWSVDLMLSPLSASKGVKRCNFIRQK